MAVLKILQLGDPILRQPAKEVGQVTKRLRKLAHDMLETMYAAPGMGLAAPQIGVSERVVVIDIGDGPLVLFDPRFLAKEGSQRDVDACLSIPGRSEYITRAQKVRVSYLNEQGKKMEIKASGLLAWALQHEIDHLDGILYLDYLAKK
jgi:peptide deformylase